MQLVESRELSTSTMLSGVDPYSNLTIGVSLTNNAGLESAIEQILVVGSKQQNNDVVNNWHHFVVVLHVLHTGNSQDNFQYR